VLLEQNKTNLPTTLSGLRFFIRIISDLTYPILWYGTKMINSDIAITKTISHFKYKK